MSKTEELEFRASISSGFLMMVCMVPGLILVGWTALLVGILLAAGLFLADRTLFRMLISDRPVQRDVFVGVGLILLTVYLRSMLPREYFLAYMTIALFLLYSFFVTYQSVNRFYEKHGYGDASGESS